MEMTHAEKEANGVDNPTFIVSLYFHFKLNNYIKEFQSHKIKSKNDVGNSWCHMPSLDQFIVKSMLFLLRSNRTAFGTFRSKL